jgi:hypothetical protein
MAEATERRGELATELPSKYLPPVEYRDLPEPVPLRKVVGASVILLATAIGSGELIIWPCITTTVGVGLLWLAAFAFATQYFLNMEIERYTLVTGEIAVTGFSRFWRPWSIIFALGAGLWGIGTGLCGHPGTPLPQRKLDNCYRLPAAVLPQAPDYSKSPRHGELSGVVEHGAGAMRDSS